MSHVLSDAKVRKIAKSIIAGTSLTQLSEKWGVAISTLSWINTDRSFTDVTSKIPGWKTRPRRAKYGSRKKAKAAKNKRPKRQKRRAAGAAAAA